MLSIFLRLFVILLGLGIFLKEVAQVLYKNLGFAVINDITYIFINLPSASTLFANNFE